MSCIFLYICPHLQLSESEWLVMKKGYVDLEGANVGELQIFINLPNHFRKFWIIFQLTNYIVGILSLGKAISMESCNMNWLYFWAYANWSQWKRDLTQLPAATIILSITCPQLQPLRSIAQSPMYAYCSGGRHWSSITLISCPWRFGHSSHWNSCIRCSGKPYTVIEPYKILSSTRTWVVAIDLDPYMQCRLEWLVEWLAGLQYCVGVTDDCFTLKLMLNAYLLICGRIYLVSNRLIKS